MRHPLLVEGRPNCARQSLASTLSAPRVATRSYCDPGRHANVITPCLLTPCLNVPQTVEHKGKRASHQRFRQASIEVAAKSDAGIMMPSSAFSMCCFSSFFVCGSVVFACAVPMPLTSSQTEVRVHLLFSLQNHVCILWWRPLVLRPLSLFFPSYLFFFLSIVFLHSLFLSFIISFIISFSFFLFLSLSVFRSFFLSSFFFDTLCYFLLFKGFFFFFLLSLSLSSLSLLSDPISGRKEFFLMPRSAARKCHELGGGVVLSCSVTHSVSCAGLGCCKWGCFRWGLLRFPPPPQGPLPL